MRPALPSAPGASRFLQALVDAHPRPVWWPSSTLRITAHSRAPELRKLGWDVKSVPRWNAAKQCKEFGFVLRSDAVTVARARRAFRKGGAPSFADELSTATSVASRTGLSMEQLKYLDRVGLVPFDVVTKTGPRYLTPTLQLLIAAGVLVHLGVGLDTALSILRYSRDEVEHALRLVAPCESAGAA